MLILNYFSIDKNYKYYFILCIQDQIMKYIVIVLIVNILYKSLIICYVGISIFVIINKKIA